MIDGINTFEVKEAVVVKGGKAKFVIYDEHKQPLCNVVLNQVYIQQEQIEPSVLLDEPKEISQDHRSLLKIILEDAEDEYTKKQIEYLVQVKLKNKSLPYDRLFWELTLSELVLLGCMNLEGNVYSVNLPVIEELMGDE